MAKRWHVRALLESLESRLILSAAHFAVVGDFGIAGTPESDVASRIASWNPDLIITTGDDNYSTGSASTIDPNIGQYYHNFIGNYTGAYGAGSAYNRFFPSLGNHDWGNAYPSPYLNTPPALPSLPYTAYFTLPGTPQAGSGFTLASPNPNTNERYYTFIDGPVQFFAIDSDTNEPDGTSPTSVQGLWLQNSLAASTAKWKLVYFHHAAYSSGNSHGNNAWMQWPFAQWGASAVLSGHDHTYERILNPSDGLLYFVEGTGGNTLNGFIASPVAGSQVRYAADYGAMDVHADDSHITFEHYTRTGTLIDSYTLYSPTSVPAAPSGLAVAVGSSSQLNLTWTDNSSNAGGNQELGSKIERSTDNVNFTQVGTVATDVTAYTDTGLTPNVTYYYRVRAYNALGNGAYSSVASNTTPVSTTSTIVAKGSTWKYLVTASAPAANWTNLGFDDSSWPAGAGELGYGDDVDGRPETTVIGYGPDANNKYPTTYFRRTFNVANPATFAALTLNLMRDDGAAIYLNGQEVWRSNLPNGAIGYSTLATNNITGTAEATYYQANFSSSLLVAGNNTIAVEVHQQFLSSLDLSFDLELIGSTAPLAAPTNLTATTAGSSQINLAWTDTFGSETGYKIERSPNGVTFDTAVATTAPNATSYSDTGLSGGTTYYYRVRAISGTNGDESYPSNVAGATTNLGVTMVAAGSTGANLPLGSDWKYLAPSSAAAPPASWKNAGFNDSAWLGGHAEFGYGDGDEKTLVDYGSDAANKYITSYYRTTFTVTSKNMFSAMVLNLVRDDGAVVYLNGTEVLRTNMPTGTVSWGTLATTAIGGTDESAWNVFSGATDSTKFLAALVDGLNTVAVEVHQSGGNSSDISFNMSLTGTVPPPTAPSNLLATAAVSGAQVNLAWTDSANYESGFKIERSSDGVNYTQIGTAPAGATSFSDTTVAVNTVYRYRVRSTNAAGDSAAGNVSSVEIEEAIISGVVFDDADGDGVTDTGDFGLAGWTVYIDANNNGALDGGETSMTTNSFGEYDLGGLFGGTYRIRHITPAGWTASVPGVYVVTLNNSASVAGRNFGDTPPTSFTGSAGADTYSVRLSADGQAVEIWNGPISGTPAYRILLSRVDTLSFSLGAGNDAVTIDGSNGTPVGEFGLSFDGGSGTNTLTLNGGTYFFGSNFFNVTGDLNLVIGTGTAVTIGDPPVNMLTAPISLNGTFAAMFAAIAAPESTPVVGLADDGVPVGFEQNVYVGAAPLGESAVTHTLVLTNVGASPADLGKIALPDGYALVGTAPTHLEPGESANLVVALQTTRLGAAAGALVVPVLGGESVGVNLAGLVKAPVGTGLLGHYFASTNLSRLKLTRVDPAVAFDWGKNAPAPGLPKDHFSVRWTGQVLPIDDGTYTFYLKASDGVRLWVDGTLVVNRWSAANTAVESKGSIYLAGGVKHTIALEYYEGAGPASVALTWTSPTMARQAIAPNQLFALELTGATPTAQPALAPALSGVGASPLATGAATSSRVEVTPTPKHERGATADPLSFVAGPDAAGGDESSQDDLALLEAWK